MIVRMSKMMKMMMRRRIKAINNKKYNAKKRKMRNKSLNN
jgi:hypothetical protein